MCYSSCCSNIRYSRNRSLLDNLIRNRSSWIFKIFLLWVHHHAGRLNTNIVFKRNRSNLRSIRLLGIFGNWYIVYSSTSFILQLSWVFSNYSSKLRICLHSFSKRWLSCYIMQFCVDWSTHSINISRSRFCSIIFDNCIRNYITRVYSKLFLQLYYNSDWFTTDRSFYKLSSHRDCWPTRLLKFFNCWYFVCWPSCISLQFRWIKCNSCSKLQFLICPYLTKWLFSYLMWSDGDRLYDPNFSCYSRKH